jgi:hypothetical protein
MRDYLGVIQLMISLSNSLTKFVKISAFSTVNGRVDLLATSDKPGCKVVGSAQVAGQVAGKRADFDLIAFPGRNLACSQQVSSDRSAAVSPFRAIKWTAEAAKTI